MLKFSDIAKIFEEIELRLISSLKRNLALHKKWENEEGFKWSAWQAEKIQNIDKFRRENQGILGEYTDVIDRQTRTLMEEQFKEGEELVNSQIDDILSETTANDVVSNDFFGVNRMKMDTLMSDITRLEKDVSSAALRMTDDIYRQTLNKAQLSIGTGSMSPQEAIDSAVKDFIDKGINCIEYRDGRRVNIADYVRMALRTTSTRAALQGEAKRRTELGYDTVLVSQYSACSDTCLPWQGRVYIDDVFTVWNGERSGGRGRSNYCGKWFTLLSVAIRAGLFHPNCRHTMTTWIDGISSKQKPLDISKVRETAKLEAKQRRLENKVRQAKRSVLGYSDPRNIKQAKSDLKEAQRELREFVSEHTEVLRRDYEREKVYDKVDGKSQNYAKTVEIFNDNEVPENANITAEQIHNDLKTSKTGIEAIETLENLPQRMKLTYEPKGNGIRGEEKSGNTVIYLSNCKDIKTASCSVIHECTHYKYGIGESQWAECVCVAQELKHRRGREYLTIAEKRTIIKAVKESYGEYNWRKGGRIYGRKTR